jgi:hypothetical protein
MGTIRINGKIYETFTDEGVERFKLNNLISKMCINSEILTSDMIKLTELGAISLMDLFDYYAGIGFTVSGVQELSFFEDFNFEQDFKEPDLVGDFADWVSEKGYRKRTHTHPSKVGKWYSEIQDTGYLSTQELVKLFKKDNQ